MELTPVLIVGIIFASLVAIAVGPAYLKSRERRETQETVRRAIDKGQPLPPEVIDAMTKDVAKNLPSRNRDIRRGVIWMAVGIGVGCFSLLSTLGDRDWGHEVGNGLLGVASIPFIIGLAFLVLSFFNKNDN